MTRCTLEREATLTGTAVRSHHGEAALTLRPGDEGIVFVRDDTGERFPARHEHLVGVPNCTALGESRVPKVLFIEHVLSALYGLGYTDAEVAIDGPEVPLLDGSALPIVEALAAAGRRELDGELAPIVLDEPVWYIQGEQALAALPGDALTVDYTFRHEHPRIARDHLRLEAGFDFAEQVAPARTFATDTEIKWLMDQGLVVGGSENNLLVVYDDRFSAPLRLAHEFAAHKVLDLLGDLALLGRPLQARLVAYRTGHSDNHALGQAIRASMGGPGAA